MSCGQVEDQPQLAGQVENYPQLTEDLWLLPTLRFPKPASNLPELGREAYNRLVLSDTIALYLTTDDQDGVVAAFYMPQDNILLLAKCGSSDPLHISESTLFFRILASANGFEDLLPFLARRSCTRVDKRIRKLRQSFGILYDELLYAARQYEPTNTELHGSWYRNFIQIIQANSQLDMPSFKQVIVHALTFCKDRLETYLEFSNKAESHRPFAELLYAASTLLNSRFLQSYTRSKVFNRLGRHLEKVTDYLDVSRLIKVWQRYGQDTRIKWINDVEQSVPRTLATAGVGERYLEAVYERKVHERTNYRPYMFSNMDMRYPGWQGEATSEGITFTPCIHAEINLILYLMGSVKNLQTHLDEPLPIGCGERSCFACSLWIDEFNRLLNMKWTTSRNNGRPRYDWALPSAKAIVPYTGVEGYNKITSRVRQAVTDAIEKVINKELMDAVDASLEEGYWTDLRNSSFRFECIRLINS